MQSLMRKKPVPLLLIIAILGTIALGCIGTVQSYDTKSKPLSPGQTATINDVAFTVKGYKLLDKFVGNHDLNIFYNIKGHKFLYVLVNAKNVGSKPIEIPSQYDVSVIYSNRPFRPEVSYHSEEFEMYEFNVLEEAPVEPHQVREGWVLFEVPETINTSNIQVVVEFPHTSYTRTAIWNLTSE
jgi:hypothetical protein